MDGDVEMEDIVKSEEIESEGEWLVSEYEEVEHVASTTPMRLILESYEPTFEPGGLPYKEQGWSSSPALEVFE
ncbi:hypothetical protein TWF281_001466 [Arthrobotrys megalospora]